MKYSRFVVGITLFLVADTLALANETLATIARPQLDANVEAERDSFLSRGYTPLFNGKDLSGWRNPYSHGEASVVDGEIHLKADNKFFLVTEQKYSNFRLSVDIHLPEGPSNSGVMFRCHVDEDAEKKCTAIRPNAMALSDVGPADYLTKQDAAGYGRAQRAVRQRSFAHEEESQKFFAEPRVRDALNRNGWNRYTITCIDDVITIELNGVQTVRFRDAMDSSGFIGIQHHGEKGQTYRFRNLFIKELPLIPASEHVSLTEQEPVSIKRINDKVTLIDFGKVAFGNIVMPVPADGRGTVNVHFGEKIKEGCIDRSPPGTVRYGMTSVRRGQQRGNWIVPTPVDDRNIQQSGRMNANPPAVLTPSAWQPVMPFRWIEIEGLEADFAFDQICRRAAFSKTWNDDASSFECSDETLNRIWDLCKYSIKATTFAGVYVDGDRERIPYEADAYLNQLSHYSTDDHVTMAARTFDWLMENGTWPTEWAPHMVFMAHAEWMNSGDTKWLQQRYESLKSKTLLHRSGDDGLVRSDELDRSRHDIVDWPQKERDGFVFTEINTVVNAFHIEALKQMAEMAMAVGKTEDADAFAARAELAVAAFQKTLFDEETGIYRDGVGTEHSSIHANFFPLAFGLVPEDKQAGVVDWLATKGMDCSVYAAQYFMDALFQNGGEHKALALMLADGDRSWKHMVNSGTTITWEAWEMKYKPNQDWNHAWGAAPANLLPRHVLGVQPVRPGWKRVLVRPCPGDLKFARGKVPSKHGPIHVDWNCESGFKLSVDLPEGVTANLDLPELEGAESVSVNGSAVSVTKKQNRWVLDGEFSGSILVEAN